jgi:hypothetical protein
MHPVSMHQALNLNKTLTFLRIREHCGNHLDKEFAK